MLLSPAASSEGVMESTKRIAEERDATLLKNIAQVYQISSQLKKSFPFAAFEQMGRLTAAVQISEPFAVFPAYLYA